ncbi:MAG: hypothetical protein IT314_12185 [Anaerolineales bacterium]|nr:hypothetical protein [Anaerolineales bacterium]
MATTLSSTVLNRVANSLVATRKFATVDEALWELARTAIRGKISLYRRRIRRMENKYDMDFDDFAAHLKGRATPAEEDDWQSWRSARRMMSDWQKAYRDLLHAQPH